MGGGAVILISDGILKGSNPDVNECIREFRMRGLPDHTGWLLEVGCEWVSRYGVDDYAQSYRRCQDALMSADLPHDAEAVGDVMVNLRVGRLNRERDDAVLTASVRLRQQDMHAKCVQIAMVCQAAELGPADLRAAVARIHAIEGELWALKAKVALAAASMLPGYEVVEVPNPGRWDPVVMLRSTDGSDEYQLSPFNVESVVLKAGDAPSVDILAGDDGHGHTVEITLPE